MDIEKTNGLLKYLEESQAKLDEFEHKLNNGLLTDEEYVYRMEIGAELENFVGHAKFLLEDNIAYSSFY